MLRQLQPQLPAAAHLAASGASGGCTIWNVQRKEYAAVRGLCLGRASNAAAASGSKRKPEAEPSSATRRPCRLAPSRAAEGARRNPQGGRARSGVGDRPYTLTLRKLQPLLAAALGLEAPPLGGDDQGANSEPEEGELLPRTRPGPSQAQLRDLIHSVATLR